MTIFITYLKRIFARPLTVGFTVAIPALVALLSGTDGGAGIRTAFIDYDDSALSHMVADAVAPVSVFVDIEEHEIDAALVDGRIEYALVLPHGMEDAVLRGERARIRSHSLTGAIMTGAVRSAADAVLSTAHNVARHVEGDRDAFTRALTLGTSGPLTVRTETFQPERAGLSGEVASDISQLVGMLTLTKLTLMTIVCFIFLKDVEKGIFHRTLAGPVSIRRYMIETNAAFFVATALQGLVTAGVIGVLFPHLTRGAILTLTLVLVVFSLVAVSFALAVAAIAKTVRRTRVTANFLIIAMAMLGGAFWPVEIMPPFLQRVSAFTPVMWTTTATQAILSGENLYGVLPHIGILFLFATVFQLLGSWRRVDIAK